MTYRQRDQFVKIDNEQDARKFVERYFKSHRRDPVMKKFPPVECFQADLRDCFGEDNLDGDSMPFVRIAMWSKIAAELRP